MALLVFFFGPNPADSLDGPADSNDPSRTRWILFILGGDVDAGGVEEGYENLLALQERMGFVNRGISPEEATQIGVAKYVPEQAEVTSCRVCLQEFTEGEDVRSLPREHCFHQTCIDYWLVNHHNSCPLCREPAVKREDKALPIISPPLPPARDLLADDDSLLVPS